MSAFHHSLQKLIVFMLAVLACLLSTPAFAAFSIPKAQVLNETVEAGQIANTEVEIASNAEMNDVMVQISIVDSTRRVVSKQDFKSLEFKAGEPVPLKAGLSTERLKEGKYTLTVGIYNAPMTKTFYFAEDLAPFKVTSGTVPKQTGEPELSIVSSEINPNAGTFGEVATAKVTLRSATELSNVTIQVAVHSKKGEVSHHEFKSQSFKEGQSLVFNATFPTMSFKPGKYSVSVRVTSDDKKTSYISKQKLSHFSITKPAEMKTTGMGDE